MSTGFTLKPKHSKSLDITPECVDKGGKRLNLQIRFVESIKMVQVMDQLFTTFPLTPYL
jgi:hypothetical protein